MEEKNELQLNKKAAKTSTYNFDKKSFIVSPVFCNSSENSITDVLFRLIESENKKSDRQR